MRETKVVCRTTGRLFVVDHTGRLLLLRGFDPARPQRLFWFTPGGGIDEGETTAEAAARELFEETGLRVTVERLGPPVWHDFTEFSFDGVTYRQDQDFYLLRVPTYEVTHVGLEPDEVRSFAGYRWWPLEALATSGELIFPADPAEILTPLLGSPPTRPDHAAGAS